MKTEIHFAMKWLNELYSHVLSWACQPSQSPKLVAGVLLGVGGPSHCLVLCYKVQLFC